MKVKCDHGSKFSNLSNWKEEAQLVEYRTGIAGVMGSSPVEAQAPVVRKPIKITRG